MKKILIFGGNGYLGSGLARGLKGKFKVSSVSWNLPDQSRSFDEVEYY